MSKVHLSAAVSLEQISLSNGGVAYMISVLPPQETPDHTTFEPVFFFVDSIEEGIKRFELLARLCAHMAGLKLPEDPSSADKDPLLMPRTSEGLDQPKCSRALRRRLGLEPSENKTGKRSA